MLVFIHSASIFQLHDGPFGLIGGLVSYSHAVGDDWFFALDEVFFFAWHSEFNSALFQSCIRRQALARKFAWTFFFSFRLVFYSSFGLKHCMVLEIWRFGHGKTLHHPRHSRVSLAATLLWVFIPYYYYYYCPTALTTSSCSYGFLPLGTVDNFCWRRTGLEAQMT